MLYPQTVSRLPVALLMSALLVLALPACGGSVGDLIGESKGPKILIDGNFSDWGGIPILMQEGSNNTNHPNGIDWAQVKVTHTDDWIYFHVTSHDPFRMYEFFPQLSWRIYLDLDLNGTQDVVIFATQWAKIGPPAISGPVLIGPTNAVTQGPLISAFEIAIPRSALEQVLPGVQSMYVSGDSVYGGDDIPNGGPPAGLYVLD